MDYGLNKNQEGYNDPTAYKALRALIAEEETEEKRVSSLIAVLKYIINLAGFSLAARIELRGKSGRVYK